MNTFYKPHDGWAADFIPIYAQGVFHLFYLKDYRDPAAHGEGTPWFHLSTTDFVHFEDHGEALARGGADAQDLFVFTGSVIETTQALGQYHIFYTGHNPHLRAQGKPEQAVMHAVSDDLVTWRKIPEDTFFAPAGKDDLYEPHDWRDPFVFFDEATQGFGMLLAARLKTGRLPAAPSRRRGCTALCTSKDLKTWAVRDSFWTPNLYFTHECPDLFQMGEWWYLVFSEFSERCVTRYRMSRSPAGPWLTPPDDTFDGRAYYAAKTASDGTRRFIFGWNPTRVGEKDDGAWQWGGNLVVHEVVQRADGTLAVKVPDTVDAIYSQRTPVTFAPALGACAIGTASAHFNAIGTEAAGSFACATAGPMPERFKIEATLSFSEGAQSFGLMLRADDALEAAYYLRFEPHQQRVVFDAWPRPGDKPYWPELERPLALVAGQPITLKLYIEGSVCEVYVNDTMAMSTRLYNLKAGQWGVFASEGAVVCEHAAVCLPTDDIA